MKKKRGKQHHFLWTGVCSTSAPLKRGLIPSHSRYNDDLSPHSRVYSLVGVSDVVHGIVRLNSRVDYNGCVGTARVLHVAVVLRICRSF